MKKTAKAPLLAAAFLLAASLAAAAPLVFIDPVSLDICEGEFTVDVVVNDEVLGFTGFDLLIDFDETVVEYVLAVEGPLLADDPGDHFFYETVEGTTSNALLINGALLGGSLDGPGVIATITFSCLADGPSVLDFVSVDFRDLDNMPIVVTHQDAAVTVAGDAVVYVSPPTDSYEVGIEFPKSIMLGGGIADVNSIELTVTYNETYVETLGVDPGPDLPGGSAFAVTGSPGLIGIDIDIPAGMSGPGSVAVIRFNGIDGGTSPIMIEDLVLATTTGTVIEPCVEHGTVTITGPTPVQQRRWGLIKDLYR